MLIDVKRLMIYRCLECEEVNKLPLNIFKVLPGDFYNLKCKCNESKALIKKAKQDKYSIELPCYICGQIHKYEISFKTMWFKPITLFRCDLSGFNIGGICNLNKTNQTVEIIDEDYDELDDGFDEMLEDDDKLLVTALNIIHDFAVQNKVYCKCNSHDIGFDLEDDSVVLKCMSCGAAKKISIESKNDLQALVSQKAIVLDGKAPKAVKKAKVFEFVINNSE